MCSMHLGIPRLLSVRRFFAVGHFPSEKMFKGFGQFFFLMANCPTVKSPTAKKSLVSSHLPPALIPFISQYLYSPMFWKTQNYRLYSKFENSTSMLSKKIKIVSMSATHPSFLISIFGFSQLTTRRVQTPPLKKSRFHFLVENDTQCFETDKKLFFWILAIFIFLRYNRSKMGKFVSIWLQKQKKF